MRSRFFAVIGFGLVLHNLDLRDKKIVAHCGNMMGIGVKMKKVVVFSVKGCYRVTYDHPFLLCFLLFVVLLYRSFPLIFFTLVSASPVLICTLLLLGTLLSFGKTSMPKSELENYPTREVVILKATFTDDNNVERNESEFVEKCSDGGMYMEDKLTERTIEIVNGIGNVGLDGSYGKNIEKISRDKEFDDRVQEEGKKRVQGLKLKHKRKTLEARIANRKIEDNQYSLITAADTDDEGDLFQEDREFLIGSVDSNEVNVDDLDSLPGSPWKHVEKEDGYEDDDEALDSGSDGAESPSPDALISEISPILDELHPLLDENASLPPNMSRNDSDASLELTISSSRSSSVMNDDIDEPEELMIEEDDNKYGDGDEEEEINEGHKYRTKSAIIWTEEDQKNLMDLGTSELERNNRLENLIAKRKARRCMTSVTERNLIDLDITDLPINVPPIATARSNPFDPPLESYEITSLPPIPDSAPSTKLPWKNPFDIPFDLSDDNPELVDNGFQEVFMPQQSKDSTEKFNVHTSSFGMNRTEKQAMEFMPQQSKDPTFRRHESFNVHPSSLGMNRTGNRLMEFMPQQSKDSTLCRHESFNASLSSDRIERQVMNNFRPYFVSERLGSEGIDYSPINRQPSEASGSKASSVPDTESFSSTEEQSFIIDAEDDNAQEPEMISKIDDASELVGHGSESSEEEEEEEQQEQQEQEYLELGQVENRHIKVDELDMKLEDVDNHQETESGKKTERKIANQIEIVSGDILQNTESLDTTNKEPVYDSSPSENFDPQVDLSAIMVKKSVSFSSRVIQIGSRGVNIDAIVDKVMLANNSEKTSAKESDSMSRKKIHMTNLNDMDYDSATNKISRSSMSSNILKNVPDDTLGIGKSSTKSLGKENIINGHKASHKDHQGAFESPVCAEEVDSFRDVSSDSDDTDMKDTLHNTPEDSVSEEKTPDFSDVGSPGTDIKYSTQNTPEDTASEAKTPDFSDVGSPGTNTSDSMQNTPEEDSASEAKTLDFSDVGSAEINMKDTRQNTPDDSEYEATTPDFSDAGSPGSSVKGTMQNTPEYTASEAKTPDFSDVGSPGTNMKNTMQNTPEDSVSEAKTPDFSDVGSPGTNMKYNMQNTPEDTASEAKTPDFSEVGSPNTNNIKEKSSNKSSEKSSYKSSSSSSSSNSGHGPGSYASLSDSHSD